MRPFEFMRRIVAANRFPHSSYSSSSSSSKLLVKLLHIPRINLCLSLLNDLSFALEDGWIGVPEVLVNRVVQRSAEGFGGTLRIVSVLSVI